MVIAIKTFPPSFFLLNRKSRRLLELFHTFAFRCSFEFRKIPKLGSCLCKITLVWDHACVIMLVCDHACMWSCLCEITLVWDCVIMLVCDHACDHGLKMTRLIWLSSWWLKVLRFPMFGSHLFWCSKGQADRVYLDIIWMTLANICDSTKSGFLPQKLGL